MSKIVNIRPLAGMQTLFMQAPETEVLFAGEAGAGKIVYDDSVVLTPYGYKKGIDINIGTLLNNPDGTLSKIAYIHPETIQQVWRVHFHDKSFTDVAEEHLWLSWRAGYGRKTLGDIHTGEKTAHIITTSTLKKHCDKANEQKNHGRRPSWPLIPVCKPQIFNVSVKYPIDIDPYLFGYLLGDGCFTHKTVSLTCSIDDYPNLIECLKKESCSIYHVKNTNVYQVNFIGESRKHLLKHIKRAGLCNKRSYEKFIPREFKMGSISVRTKVLQGLMDSDGYIDARGQCSFTSASLKLAEDVKFLIQSLGGTATPSDGEAFYRKSNGEKVICKRKHNLYIKTLDDGNLFQLPRKKNRSLKSPANLMHRRVVNVEVLSETKKGRCITVSNPNGLYITNDFIVTHNSFALVVDAMRYIHEAGYKAVIFRRTYPEVADLITLARQIYVPCGAKLNESQHTFTWPNGAVIMFRHLQHLKDIYSHMGREYDYIGFDELPNFPKLAYIYLFSRLRGTNPNIKRYMRATGNPDGQFVMWVKERFVDSQPMLRTGYFKTVLGRDVKVTRDTPGSISRKFIPCIRSENRVLMDNDPGYEARLDQLPEDKKRALKEGIWTVSDKPNQLIINMWWENALCGKNEYIDDKNYTIGADFGTHQGTDYSVEILGKGNRPYRVKSWKSTRTSEFALILSETAKSVERSHVMIGVDSIGPGTGVADELEMHHNMSAILDRCNHKDPIYDAKYKGDIQFDNLRSQMWWKFKTDMENGDIDLSAFQSEEGYFDDFSKLQEEVFAHTFRVYNGKLIVISKHELRKAELLGRSPDYADALVIWNWVRRHHMEKSKVEVTGYNVDGYMEEWFRKDDSTDDEGTYYDDEHDGGDYSY